MNVTDDGFQGVGGGSFKKYQKGSAYLLENEGSDQNVPVFLVYFKAYCFPRLH